MNKKIYDGYTYVDGGVCAAKGFTANGLNCGLNPDKNKNDLGMVFSEVPCVAAGVYTQNKVKGAPVTVTKEHLKKSGNKAQAYERTCRRSLGRRQRQGGKCYHDHRHS